MAEILIVDDERSLRESLRVLLQGEDFEVRTARDGDEALKKISEKQPDLVLLDVMMPKMNGYKCCEKIREKNKLLPIIFLTSKDAEMEQLRGMSLGADDFISKDVSDAILLARINRALTRSHAIDEKMNKTSGEMIEIGNISINLKTFAVFENEKEIACLTKTEADILKLLYSQRGKLIVSDDLITELRGKGFACEDAMLYAHIYNLRKKLGSAASLLINKRGVGYSLNVL